MFRFLKSTPIFFIFSIFTLYWQMRTPAYFIHSFNLTDPSQLSLLIVIQVFSSFIFFCIVPAFVSRFFYTVKLKDLGLKFPAKNLKTLFATIFAFLLLVPTIYYLTKLPSVKSFYTLHQINIIEIVTIAIFFPFYYFSEEFYFRGFLFLSLWERVGIHSFWITDIVFTLAHIGKPGMEILLCIPASVVFNCLTLYTKSIFPAIFVHSSMGVLCIVWSNYNQLI